MATMTKEEQAALAAAAGRGYDLSDYLRQQQEAQTEAELAGLKSAYETSLRGYDAAAEQVPAAYQQARNTAAARSAQEKRAFDERAEASGLNSGTGAQAQLFMSSAYQDQLGQLDREQAKALSEIDLEKANLRSEYQSAIAAAKAESEANLSGALYNELLRVQGLKREDEQQQAIWDREDAQLAAAQKREDQLTAAEKAEQDRRYALQLALELGVTDPAALSQITGMADLTGLTAQKEPEPIQEQETSGAGDIHRLTPEELTSIFGSEAGYTSGGSLGIFDPKTDGTAAAHFGTKFVEISARAQQLQKSGASEQEVDDYLNNFAVSELTDDGLRYILSHMGMHGYGR